MRILFTNNTLESRAGTELYVRDVAMGLLQRGHEVVAFSLQSGAVAEELQAARVTVTDDLRTLTIAPDVIHGQHAVESTLAAMFFPRTPVVSFCHGPEAWQEAPCRLPNVFAWVAVDITCKRRLIEDERIPEDRVRLLLNFANLQLFQTVRNLSPQPQRALLFSNYLTPEHPVTLVVKTTCETLGIQLDFCGTSLGNLTAHPEQLLPMYDVVFAKGRSAIEALASGCAVIPVEYFNAGELITTANYERERLRNFGYMSMTFEVTVTHIMEQLRGYDAEDAAKVTARIRAEATLEKALDHLEELYAEARLHSIPDFNPTSEAFDFLRFQLYLSKLPIGDLQKTLKTPLRLPVPPLTTPMPELWAGIRSAHTPSYALAHANALSEALDASGKKWEAKEEIKNQKIEALKAELHELKSRPRGLKKLSRKFKNIFSSHSHAHD